MFAALIQDLKQRTANAKHTGYIDVTYTTYSTDPADSFEMIIQMYEKDDLLFMRGDDNKDFPGKWMIDKYKIPIKYVEYTKGISSTKLREELL